MARYSVGVCVCVCAREIVCDSVCVCTKVGGWVGGGDFLKSSALLERGKSAKPDHLPSHSQ